MRITIDISWWTMRRFLHWWMCQGNPDKEIEWLNPFPDFTETVRQFWTPPMLIPIGSADDHSFSDVSPDDPAN